MTDNLNEIGGQLHELMKRHGVYSLMAEVRSGKTDGIKFDVYLIDAYAEVRNQTVRHRQPSITLSPKILEHGFSTKEALSVLVLHELGHIDHIERAWGDKELKRLLEDPDQSERYADDFVVKHGWKNELILTLRAMEKIRIENGQSPGAMTKRLQYLEKPNAS
jgi:hypothetical protein